MAAAPAATMCPCPDDPAVDHGAVPNFLVPTGESAAARHRALVESDDDGETWEIVYMCVVLLLTFVALLSDKVGADMVMLSALTLCMAADIITVEEGVSGFANEGLLTVLVLFVVAAGISHTGALDWYMGKLLGRPDSTASAQLRLMIPIAFVSAFLNNTPVVAVMIPIVQRWGKNVGVNPQQLLVPLSFASILGGTCTLIGTSTNLVVVGLMKERYPDDPEADVGLFDLGRYGVPVAIAGVAYILIASPCLLPGGTRRRRGGGDGGDDTAAAAALPSDENVFLGARLTKWSSAAGRSVKRSGLRDTGGIYLVSVHRAATGNVHRAVGQDFVLNVGDILYFTGLVEGFGEFCEEHGLEVVTNEVEEEEEEEDTLKKEQQTGNEGSEQAVVDDDKRPRTVQFHEKKEVFGDDDDGHAGGEKEDDAAPALANGKLYVISEHSDEPPPPTDVVDTSKNPLGTTKESLLNSDEGERLRSLNRMTDRIRGMSPSEPYLERQETISSLIEGPACIVVLTDSQDELVVVGINAPDRPGLLLDISRGLHRLNLQLHHTEAAVVNERSLSIWRCEALGDADMEEIWSVLNAMLENESGVAAIKQRGLRVVRAAVTKYSNLIDKNAAEVDFRQTYKAAIVAVQKSDAKGGQAESLSKTRFASGDVLILQASDDSPLLVRPPDNFYKKLLEAHKGDAGSQSSSSLKSLVKMVANRFSNTDLKGMKDDSSHTDTVSSPPKEHPAAVKPVDLEAAHPESDFYIPESASEGNLDSMGSGDHIEALPAEDLDAEDDVATAEALESVWKDLRVVFPSDDKRGDVTREFLTAMEIAERSALAGKTVSQSGLDKLPGVFLVSIERPIARKDGGEKRIVIKIPTDNMSRDSSAASFDGSFLDTEPTLVAVSPDDPLKERDILWFSGSAAAVGDLRKIPGLVSFESEEVQKINEKVHDRRLVQAVVARKSPLVGRTVAEVKFRTRYGAAVIAVHREGKRVHDHPGKVKLHAGDVLLLEAGPTFIERNAENDKSFALLSEVEDSAPPRLRLLIPALVLAIVMLAVFTAGVASLLVCALVAAILMVCIGILSQQEARDAINWEVYITIACAFGIGTALTNSGVAGGVADFLVNVGEAVNIGDAGLYGAVYLATFMISNVVTNNAAAALIFPIAMDAAEQTGADRLLMSYCLMLGASASFMSPFGYTTNLLIYGPGGYKYKDFLLIGTPMQVVLWILSVGLLSQPSSSPWYISWIVTSAVLILVSMARTSSSLGRASLSSCRRKPK